MLNIIEALHESQQQTLDFDEVDCCDVCFECNGSGYTYLIRLGNTARRSRRWRRVPDPCPYCDGTGFISTGI